MVVRPENMVSTCPLGKTKETIGGFMIVKTDSVGEAVGFENGCPVLQGKGNSVEVRKTAKVDGAH